MARTHTFILALSSIAAIASLSRSSPATSAGSVAATACSDSLFNASSDEILTRLGPPSYIRPRGPEFTSWGWLDADGSKRTVTLYQDRVMTMDPEGPWDNVKAVELPKGVAFIGQRVEDLISTRGRPDRVAVFPTQVSGNRAAPIGVNLPVAPSRLALVFGDDWVELHAGRVKGIGPKPTLPKITGPR